MPTDKNGYYWPQWYIAEMKRSDPVRYAALTGKERREEETDATE